MNIIDMFLAIMIPILLILSVVIVVKNKEYCAANTLILLAILDILLNGFKL